MVHIEGSENFDSFINRDRPSCVVFSADWCPDCQVLKAVLPGLEQQYEGRIDFAIVNRDEHMELAEEYDIMGIPSLVVFRRGELMGSYISKLRKTRAQIVDFLDELIRKVEA